MKKKNQNKSKKPIHNHFPEYMEKLIDMKDH